jgi:carbon storage regulator CsrA
MLVLARSTGQSVVLDDRITVTVLATRGTLVRLGIEAAPDVAVRRGELALLDPPPLVTEVPDVRPSAGLPGATDR